MSQNEVLHQETAIEIQAEVTKITQEIEEFRKILESSKKGKQEHLKRQPGSNHVSTTCHQCLGYDAKISTAEFLISDCLAKKKRLERELEELA